MFTTEATLVISIVLVVLIVFLVLFAYFSALDLFSILTKRTMFLSIFEGSTLMGNGPESVDDIYKFPMLLMTQFTWNPSTDTQISLISGQPFHFESHMNYQRSNRYVKAFIYYGVENYVLQE